MSIKEVFVWLFVETWWTWDRAPGQALSLQDHLCRYFNIFEATAWFIFAILVFFRWLRYRRSATEIAYMIAFFLFGVSDIIEAWKLTSWLLWWKVLNLVVIFSLRRSMIRWHYPDQRLF